MRWAFYGLAAFVLAVIVGAALFPLSLALKFSDAPIEGTPSGTVWRGSVSGTVIDGVKLGELGIAAQPLATLTGTPTAALTVDGPAGNGEARVAKRGAALDLTDLSGVFPLAPLGIRGPFGAPMTGNVAVGGHARFDRAGCLSAELMITTDVLRTDLRTLGQEGFDLAGPARCEDGVLVADLAGAGPSGEARLVLRLRPGVYTSELTLQPTDARAAAVLERYGFRTGAGGSTLVTRGTW